MPRLSMMPTLFREVLSKREFPREPEPDLVMDDKNQVEAYAEAGRIDGVMSAAYLFQTARISQVIAGAKRVVDLACGPATQLAQIAELNPDIEFVGVDLSEQMLIDAQTHIEQLGLKNVSFIHSDITDVKAIESGSVDAVISTMALHHLPTYSHLESTFREIERILGTNGRVYLTDFSRLKRLRSVLFFAYLNRACQPHLFSLDYERSLRAAFLRSDFRKAAELLSSEVELYSTFAIPVLQVLKTADQELSAEKKQQLKAMRKALPARYRRELDDIRFFFWMSGLRKDPFR